MEVISFEVYLSKYGKGMDKKILICLAQLKQTQKPFLNYQSLCVLFSHTSYFSYVSCYILGERCCHLGPGPKILFEVHRNQFLQLFLFLWVLVFSK